MSLLIKALEQAARQREGGRPARPVQPPVEPTLEPLTLEPAPATPEAAPLALEPAPSGPVRPGVEEQRARAAAVLQAGSGPHAALIDYLKANRVVAMLAVAGLILLGYGVYFYLQLAHPRLFVRPPPLQVPSAGTSAVPAAPAPALEPALIMPVTAPAPLDTPLAAALGRVKEPADAAASAAVAEPAAPAPAVSLAPPISAPAEPRAAGEPIPTTSVISGATAAAPQTVAAPPAERPPRPVREPRAPPPQAPEGGVAEARPAPAAPPARERISVSAGYAAPALHPQVEPAYGALQTGRLDEARALYGEVVRSEPLNVDALLGLAYIAARQERREEALAHYLRILQIEPRHSVAQAALIALMGRADPAASETRLKQLIAAEPSAFLHFVLGNLYADQQLWPQAQQAYFQAHHLEPGNADYAFNLAIGLDHLGQRKLALTYYRRATELAAARAQVNFSLGHARERIASLSAQLD
jgi:tetratricopeptide (TPR) repeat protein